MSDEVEETWRKAKLEMPSHLNKVKKKYIYISK